MIGLTGEGDNSMGKLIRSLTSGACAAALAFGMVPQAALAADDLRAGTGASTQQVQAQRQLQAQERALDLRAQQIDAHEGTFSDDGIIVVYRDGAAESRQAASGMSAQSVSVAGIPDATSELLTEDSGIPGGGAAVRVELPQGISVGRAVATAETDPMVVHAQPIYRYKLLSLPNDPVLANTENAAENPNQWWIPAVNAEEAWDVVHADHKVSVAVLDTGINFDHPDLKNNILTDYAYDSYANAPLTESPLSSEMAHGSHVAGIVSAEADNGQGIAGVSYNANILPICVFHEEESYEGSKATCDDEDLIRAYDYLLSDPDGNGRTVAQETNTHVVNMSLGGYLADDPEYEYDYAFEAKIEQAQDEGILTVAAAGNGDDYGQGRSDASYPSDYKAVMSVIALQDQTTRTPWSDYNDSKNISAPGADIYSTWYYDDKYQFSSGTSMASPIVAGCAALLWAYDPDLSVDDVKQALYATADDLGAPGFDARYGWGRVNLGAAVKSLGTASVKAERTTMMRTASQQMTAASISNSAETHRWEWSVCDPSTGQESAIARISPNGVLTALAAGTVEVRVRSTDTVTPLEGRRTIQISEIEIPGGATASANPGENTIAVRWARAEAAVGYRVLRATEDDGTFEQIAELSAAELGEGESLSYLDRTAKPSVPYWYQVVPVGELDGDSVVGAAATSNRCYFTDKSALKRQISAAEELLANTKSSLDGADVNEDEFWTLAADRSALNQVLSRAYNAFYSGSMLQEAVDERTAQLAEAQAAFEAARQPGKIAVAPKQAEKPAAEAGAGAGGSSASSGSDAAVSGGAAAAGTVAGAAAGAASAKSGAGTTAGASSSKSQASEPAAVSFAKAKAANPMRVKAKAAKKALVVKYSKAKKRTVKAAKAFKVMRAQGKVTFKKIRGTKRIAVSKTGKITVKKGTPRGTYTLKVNVTAAGNAKYKAKTVKAVKVKIRVK